MPSQCMLPLLYRPRHLKLFPKQLRQKVENQKKDLMDLSFVVKPKENPGDNPKTLNDTWARSRADFDRSINQSLGWDETIVPCNETQLERTQLEVTQIPSSECKILMKTAVSLFRCFDLIFRTAVSLFRCFALIFRIAVSLFRCFEAKLFRLFRLFRPIIFSLKFDFFLFFFSTILSYLMSIKVRSSENFHNLTLIRTSNDNFSR